MALRFDFRLLLVIVPAALFGLWVGMLVVPPIVKVVVPAVVRIVAQ